MGMRGREDEPKGEKGREGYLRRKRGGKMSQEGWGGLFLSQPKCLLQEVVCRRGGIPVPLKSGCGYLVTPVGLP